MEFTEFHDWVYKELGVSLNSYKPTQLNRRIGSLMERLGVKSLEDYIQLLKRDNEQRENFLDYITINVTEFFRNPEFFQALKKAIEENILPNTKKIKIWSAGCSMGCEAYSLCMLLNEIEGRFDYNIIATDIDKNILRRAKEACYSNMDVKTLDKKYLDKYFVKCDDKYIIDQKLKSKVSFKRHDLIIDKYDKDFDLILCRNVIIYFKDDVKQKIIEGFIDSLKPGGLLFVGATESINTYKIYGLEKLSPFIYRKI